MSLPRKSPWGEVKRCSVLHKGIFSIRTSIQNPSSLEQGGIMVRFSSAKFLSDAAKKCGFRKNGYICFEKECSESVVIRELLDKNLWEIPPYIVDKAMYEEKINLSIQQFQPEYWEQRQKRLPLSERLKAGADKAITHNADSGRTDAKRTDKTELR